MNIGLSKIIRLKNYWIILNKSYNYRLKSISLKFYQPYSIFFISLKTNIFLFIYVTYINILFAYYLTIIINAKFLFHLRFTQWINSCLCSSIDDRVPIYLLKHYTQFLISTHSTSYVDKFITIIYTICSIVSMMASSSLCIYKKLSVSIQLYF